MARKTSPKTAAPSAPSRGLPSRDELVAFIASEGGKVGKREIARAFRISGAERVELKRMLHELQDEGVVARKGKRLASSIGPSTKPSRSGAGSQP
ncbi:hypothetical protein ACIKTA_18745, partial [Hansschlegelia beijingensis]